MAETQIEWTDATWNPVAGCTIVSAGCTNCYAMEMARRLQAMDVAKYKGLTRRSGKRTIWNGIVREDKSALDIPLRWKKPKKIFVNSMSDLFHEGISDAFILKVWNVMRATPHHHYQILTKRPERMGAIVSKLISDVLPNVWLGTSIESAEVVERVEHLRAAPAAIRFISFEPLIGAVGQIDLSNIHWAIVGGESGRSARPIREEWIDEIFDQCSLHDTVFFFKQWGGKNKKATGRLLLQLSIQCSRLIRRNARARPVMRATHFVAQIAGQHAPCRQHRGRCRHNDALDLQFARDLGRMQARRAAKTQERKPPGIDAAAQCHQPDAIRHLQIDHPIDAGGSFQP